MRCLNRLYEHAGDCDVCHMKLKPYKARARKLLGYLCPLHRSEKVFDKGGVCPFCGLALKEHYDGPPPPKAKWNSLQPWATLEGKTAVFYRPYDVRVVGIESLLRGAGPLRGRRLSVRLPSRGLRRGDSAMVMPPQAYTRPVLASVEHIGRGGRVELRLSRPIPGADWASAEIRRQHAPDLAVPLTALVEGAGPPKVYVMHGEAFEPRTVTVKLRGESYATISGLEAGERIAASGVFWLDAEWRMEHP
jgi:hypothetical protein